MLSPDSFKIFRVISIFSGDFLLFFFFLFILSLGHSILSLFLLRALNRTGMFIYIPTLCECAYACVTVCVIKNVCCSVLLQIEKILKCRPSCFLSISFLFSHMLAFPYPTKFEKDQI